MKTLIILVSFFMSTSAFAQGFIIPHQNIAPPELITHNIDVNIKNQVARVHVEQAFKNVSAVRMEGVYYFPIPRDASISDFAMWVDGKKLQGEILNRDEASKIYEEIVRRNIDPALLEYADNRFFRLKIFPIPPGKERRIELDYTQLLPMDNGIVRFLYPLHGDLQAGRHAGRPVPPPVPAPGMPRPLQKRTPETDEHTKTLSGCKQVFLVDIQSDVPIKNLYSPSHKVDINRKSDQQAIVSYEGTRKTEESDFVLYYSFSPEDLGMSLLCHKNEGEDGFYLLLISPKAEIAGNEILDKDVIFILDTSGSMGGEKIRQAKDALIYCLNGLRDGDRFAVLTFSSDVRAFSETLTHKNRVGDAIKFIQNISAKGGTNIDAALQKALSYEKDSNRPMNIVFLTDGLPTVGTTDVKSILKNVTKNNEDRRIFTFGVGYDVNTFLLDKLAQENHAVSDYIALDENIEEKISYFFDKVSNPVLSDLQLNYGHIRTFDVYPHELPDLFQGSQLMVVGRYKKAGRSTITLRGASRDRTVDFTYGVHFPKEAKNDFLPRLWASRRIAYLVDEIRTNGESKEVREEIEDLSKRYGIMSPYTSFLVQEDLHMANVLGAPNAKRSSSGILGLTMDAVGSFGVAKSCATTGASAVQMSKSLRTMREAEVVVREEQKSNFRYIGGRTFYWQNGKWEDSDYADQKTVKIKKGSQAFINLILTYPELGKFMSLGDEIIVKFKGKFIHISDKGIEKANKKELKKLIG